MPGTTPLKSGGNKSKKEPSSGDYPGWMKILGLGVLISSFGAILARLSKDEISKPNDLLNEGPSSGLLPSARLLENQAPAEVLFPNVKVPRDLALKRKKKRTKAPTIDRSQGSAKNTKFSRVCPGIPSAYQDDKLKALSKIYDAKSREAAGGKLWGTLPNGNKIEAEAILIYTTCPGGQPAPTVYSTIIPKGYNLKWQAKTCNVGRLRALGSSDDKDSQAIKQMVLDNFKVFNLEDLQPVKTRAPSSRPSGV